MPRYLLVVGLAASLLAGCNSKDPGPNPAAAVPNPGNTAPPKSLAEARRDFKTQLVRQEKSNEPVKAPPPKDFQQIEYPAAVGNLAAYLTPDPKDGKKHPAIIWITGGDCNSIGDVWKAQPANDDQTAGQYRKAGIVMMFPSLRGGNKNPGYREGFYGEVDDVIAAYDYLAKIEYVDPNRIYLGGHSTGGTLVLLVSEYTDKFRAVFSFGPAADTRGYPPEFAPPVSPVNTKEFDLRAPSLWLAGIQKPTFVIEGAVQGNGTALNVLSKLSKNSQIQFLLVPRVSHFSVLAPVNQVLAKKILADTEEKCNISLTLKDLDGPQKK
jgi:dienelactone hydrolase